MRRPTIRMLTMLLAVLGALITVSAADATTRYVASNGVDNLVCGLANPCRSISRAISRAIPRDTIIVGPGIYGDLNRNGILGEAGEETGGFAGCDCMLAMDRQLTLISSHGAAATTIDARHLPIRRNVYMVGGGEFGRPGQGFTVTQPYGALFGDTAMTVESPLAKVRGNQIVSDDRSANVNGLRVLGLGGSVLIEGNEIRGWGVHGIFVSGSGTIIRKNAVAGNEVGIRTEGTNTIEGNMVTGNGQGMLLFNQTTAVGNAVYGNEWGMWVLGMFAGAIEENNIFGNRTCGLLNDTSVPIVLAPNNYWGTPAGPGLDPADTVCSNTGRITQILPVATRLFVVTAPMDQ